MKNEQHLLFSSRRQLPLLVLRVYFNMCHKNCRGGVVGAVGRVRGRGAGWKGQGESSENVGVKRVECVTLFKEM